MTTAEAPTSARTAGRFQERLDAAVEANNSLLCVGLDPDPARIPAGVSVRDFLVGVIEATSSRTNTITTSSPSRSPVFATSTETAISPSGSKVD